LTLDSYNHVIDEIGDRRTVYVQTLDGNWRFAWHDMTKNLYFDEITGVELINIALVGKALAQTMQ